MKEKNFLNGNNPQKNAKMLFNYLSYIITFDLFLGRRIDLVLFLFPR